MSDFNSDFNLDEEYKEEPLIPDSDYEGTVTSVKYDGENSQVIWDVELHTDPAIVASDGETPVDGMTAQFRNFLPKPGDETEWAKNGKLTKRQSKINMFKKFIDNMNIEVNTLQDLIDGVNYSTWVGLDVFITIKNETYDGVTRSKISAMRAMQ